MLKMNNSMKETEPQAGKALEKLLREIPSLKLKKIIFRDHNPRGHEIDISVLVEISGQQNLIVCEVKQNGQPRYVREAIYQLQSYVTDLHKPATPVLIAPYLSPASRELCRENGISFLDLEGNARMVFGTVFIERLISDKSPSERRIFKSLFMPKSARVLRVLLRNPERIWRVADLADAADVSLGHVSNVRTALLEREWAEIMPGGISLKAPDLLLDAWKLAYISMPQDELHFYTTLHGSSLENSIRAMFSSMPAEANVVLASLSAAHWIAPYARTGTQFLYAERSALNDIRKELQLSSSAKGENVIIIFPKDQGVFLDSYEPSPGIRCTSPLQTYLDLSVAGERGAEAADYLRRMRLTWQK
jgi:hypothetical protein